MKKINRNEAIKLLKEYIEFEIIKLDWFKKIKPFIKAIVFYGSTAKNANKVESDLDILIFVPLKVEKRHTKSEYFYNFKKREINIVLRSIERLRKISLEKNNLFEAEVFRNSEILYEKDTEVRELIKDIVSYITKEN